MKKTIEKIKGKGIKLSARIFGAMTACFSTIVAAYADVEDCCSPRKIRKTQKCGITRN